MYGSSRPIFVLLVCTSLFCFDGQTTLFPRARAGHPRRPAVTVRFRNQRPIRQDRASYFPLLDPVSVAYLLLLCGLVCLPASFGPCLATPRPVSRPPPPTNLLILPFSSPMHRGSFSVQMLPFYTQFGFWARRAIRSAWKLERVRLDCLTRTLILRTHGTGRQRSVEPLREPFISVSASPSTATL